MRPKKIMIVVPHGDHKQEMDRLVGNDRNVTYPGTALAGRRFDQIVVFGDSFIRGRGAQQAGSDTINLQIKEWLKMLSLKLIPGGTIQYIGGHSEP